MDPVLGILLLWLAFSATHVGLSSTAVRPRLVAALGSVPFLALYSAIALVIFVPLIRFYFVTKHAGPALWVLPRGPALKWTVYAGMGVAFVLLASSFLQPSPAGMAPASLTPHGVQRITRHPLVMAFVVFALFHLLPNGWAGDVAFFGGFAAFALAAAAHQDHRKIQTGVPAGYERFVANTPFFPFTGRETLKGLRELSPIAVIVGLAAATAIRFFHSTWFGGSP
ncbi:MAG TPA: NnrU family protein [Myxococcota bacterium]|nr:NnrU family protein [Myxococcota bacterium]